MGTKKTDKESSNSCCDLKLLYFRRSLRRKANLDKYLSSQKDEERDELDEETQWNEEEEEQTEQNREQRQKKQDSDCEVCPGKHSLYLFISRNTEGRLRHQEL